MNNVFDFHWLELTELFQLFYIYLFRVAHHNISYWFILYIFLIKAFNILHDRTSSESL